MKYKPTFLQLSLPLLVLFIGFHWCSAQTTIISGIDKLHQRTRVKVTQWNPTFDSRYQPSLTIAEAQYQNDSVFTLEIPITHPTSVDFQVPERGFAHQSWVSPGDSLSVEVDQNADYPFHFSGEHAFHYNIYRLQKRWEKDLYNSGIQTFDDFKSAYQAIGHTMDSLFKSAGGDSVLTPSFVDLYREESKAKYISDLSFFLKKFDEQDKLLARQEMNHLHVELTNDELLSSRYFTYGLVQPLDMLTAGSTSEMEAFRQNVDYVDGHFENRTREFLLGYLTAQYSQVFSNQPADAKSAYTRMTRNVASQITDTTYKQWVFDNLDYVNKLDQHLPDSALNATLIDSQGNEVTMAQVLHAHKGSYLLVDIWASWCVPCVAELENAEQVKPELSKEDVKVVYFTIDRPEDYGAMKVLAKKFNIESENYILAYRDSPLSDFFNLAGGEGIPRYILFDDESKLKSLSMPRPSDFQALKGKLNEFRKVEIAY